MIGYMLDFTLVALLVVGITAFMGVMTNGLGEKFFAGKGSKDSYNRHTAVQKGWKSLGGKK